MKWLIAIVVAAFVLYEIAYLYKREARSANIYKQTLRLNAAYRDCTNQDFAKRDFSSNGFDTNWDAGVMNLKIIYTNYPDGTRICLNKHVAHFGGRDFPVFLVLYDPTGSGVLTVTTNHIFIWADAHSGAEIVDENHRPPLFRHTSGF